MRTRAVALLLAAGVAFGACSTDRDSTPERVAPPETTGVETTAPDTTAPDTTASETTAPDTTAADTTEPPTVTTAEATPTTEAAPTTTEAPTTTAAPTTTVPPTLATVPDAFDPACVTTVQSGDSLSSIVDLIDVETVTIEAIQVENSIPDVNVIRAGDVLDICPGNDLNDLDGSPRLPPPPPTTVPEPTTPVSPGGFGSGVQAQQQQLNALFGGLGFGELAVDGQSGQYTRQQLCAARSALGIPINRTDMEAGSLEEFALMQTGSLPAPPGAPTAAGRWALIDLTCQVMFVGQGGGVAFVFPTSTGEAGFETRQQQGSNVFRFDPALENEGWHDSYDFPVPEDNPLNGNMYKPLYFDNGQAIHGANNVPPEPLSKGCARLRVRDQQTLVSWLGLDDIGGPTYDSGRIGFTVSVQGSF